MWKIMNATPSSFAKRQDQVFRHVTYFSLWNCKVKNSIRVKLISIQRINYIDVIEVFLHNTNPTFLAFLYRFLIKILSGFEKVTAKYKVASSGNWTQTLTITVYKSDAYPTLLICQALLVWDCQILTKSCSTGTIFSSMIFYSTHWISIRLLN